ncbi:MAG: 3-hydroxyisobutyrate dehydrogenase [Actinomycetia bacterium]|jgi:3-hydroxyisobutyrate dehydrogenase-like beta-hydroxyacid dehydrogenase|nr:3-hydroxyisobutyrate dehydrogenase [Actinomycetes bacterium]MDQ1460571.1 3-hydroxyisobutyrate dehydrogenase [Actinomycetota bacterium]
MQIGFIGLGAMGLPMVRHLLGAGHDVTVASRSRPPIDAAIAAGARDGADPRTVVDASDITLLCVPDSPDVVEVIDAALPALGAGKIVVDASTIDPEVERAQHERVSATGASYLDAPLSGGSIGAERGTLTVMVGGDAAVLDTARPAIEPFAQLIVHAGGPGFGQIVKLCNQLVYAAQMLAVSEACALAVKEGVDLNVVHEVMTHATGDCNAIRTRIPFEGARPDTPASNGWKPGFMTALMAKDVDLVLRESARVGITASSADLVRPVLAAAVDAGYGREDFSALGKIVRARSHLP